jgi:hypothetical protein
MKDRVAFADIYMYLYMHEGVRTQLAALCRTFSITALLTDGQVRDGPTAWPPHTPHLDPLDSACGDIQTSLACGSC